MRDAGWGTNSWRDAGYDKYLGWNTGSKYLRGNGMRTFQLVACGIVLKLILGCGLVLRQVTF